MADPSSALIGAVTGLIVVILVAVLFVAAKSTDDRVRISKLTSPQRRRVLAAKALVLGLITFRGLFGW